MARPDDVRARTPLTLKASTDYASLSGEYAQLFSACVVELPSQADTAAGVIVAGRSRYETVAAKTGVPWFVIALIHTMECGGSWKQHLHNGDPLAAKTVNVPAGRPEGDPPFTWEASAIDALTYDGLASETDWSLPRVLYRLEKYNGLGYRKRCQPTPYLWAGSSIERPGKYVADGKFDRAAVSKQLGAAAILKRLVERGYVSFDGTSAVAQVPTPEVASAEQPAPVALPAAPEPQPVSWLRRIFG
jgi:lysozyme family protein